MERTVNLRDARNNKFIRTESYRNEEKKRETVRKNIVMDHALHDHVVDVIIEKEMSLNRFVVESLEMHLEKITGCLDGRRPDAEVVAKVGTSVFLPRELAKEIKRTSHATGASENMVILECIKVELQKCNNA